VTAVAQGKPDDDPNPDGEMFLKEKNPLSVAHKFLQYLLTFSPGILKTQLLGFDVAMHRKKYLLALKAIIKGLSINPNSPAIHYRVVKFFHTVASEQNLHPQTKKVIDLEKETILNGRTLQAYNEQFFSAQKSRVAGHLAYVQSAILLAPEKKNKPEIIKLLNDVEDPSYPVKDCRAVHAYFIQEYSPTLAEEYLQKCHELFPLASYFDTTPPPVDVVENTF